MANIIAPISNGTSSEDSSIDSLVAPPQAEEELHDHQQTTLNKTKTVKQQAPSAKKSVKSKYKKPPNAPKRFKTAFICFSSFKHKEIREQREQKEKNGKQGAKPTKTTNVAKVVSNAWKELTQDERDKWEDMARKDKARWDVEKEMYNGPWKVTAKECKKMKKDPDAPKRPMSSYLAYANAKRSDVKMQNPQLSNTDISRKLSDMWKEASEEEKKEYVEEEYKLRQIYLAAMAEYRETKKAEEDAKRTEREDYASSIATQRELALPQEQEGTVITQQMLSQQNDGGTQDRNTNGTMATATNSSDLVASPQADQEGTIMLQQQQQQQLLQQNSVNQGGNNVMAAMSSYPTLGMMMQQQFFQNGDTNQNGNSAMGALPSFPMHGPAVLLAPHHQHDGTQQANELLQQNNQLFFMPSSTTGGGAAPPQPQSGAVAATQVVGNNFFQNYESTQHQPTAVPGASPYQNNYNNVQHQMHQQAAAAFQQGGGGLYEPNALVYNTSHNNQESRTTNPSSVPLNNVTASYSDIWNGRHLR